MKKKTYTVYYLNGVPMIRLTGKWLEELGINIGDKLELTQDKDKIILSKMPSEEVQRMKINFEIRQLQQRLNDIAKDNI